MGIWADRTWLASQNWRTDLRIEKPCASTGDRKFGLWAKTWRWGDRIADVCLHVHGSLDTSIGRSTDFESQLDRASSMLREACARARAEFTESVPCQTWSKGLERIELATTDWETRRFLTQQAQAFTPDIINFMVDGPESGDYVSGILDGLRDAGSGLEYSDYLNPFAEPRRVRDQHPAVWQFVVRPAVRRWNGKIVKAESYRSGEVATRLIDESLAGSLARAACINYQKLFADFSPGGKLHGVTDNGLPPGHHVFVPSPPEPDRCEEDPAP